MTNRPILQLKSCGMAILIIGVCSGVVRSQSTSTSGQFNRYTNRATVLPVALGFPVADDSDDEDPPESVDVQEPVEDLLKQASLGAVPLNSFWWSSEITRPVLEAKDARPVVVSLDQLVVGALNASQRVRIAQIDGFVEQEIVTQEAANFDWNVFTENLFTGTNQPTESDLDAGTGIRRLLQDDFNNDVGLKRTNVFGGEFEVKQNVKFLSSNSEFLDPNNQAFTQLTLRYNQPLLRDGGYLVNYGQVILAQLNADSVVAESEAEILEVIEEIVRAYWDVYRLRSTYVIQRQLVQKINSLLQDIRKRTRIDASPALVGQAEAELATQTARLGAFRTDLIAAQIRLVRAVGDRNLAQFSELIPVGEVPPFEIEIDSQHALAVALSSRPEVRAAGRKISSSELLKDISYRNLLPNLALIFETSVAGVSGDFDFGKSLGDQFSERRPQCVRGVKL